MPFLLTAVPVIVLIISLADIITRGEHQVKNLTKTFWIIIVILLPVVGSILWWAVGREYTNRREIAVGFGDPRRTEQLERQLAERSLSRTEAELARLDAEIEQARADERIRQLEAELEARRRAGGSGADRGPTTE